MTHRVVAQRKPAGLHVGASACGAIGSRRCACGGRAGLDGECAACRARRLNSGFGTEPQATTAPSVLSVLRSPGRVLEPATKSFMESRFGHDFGPVRIHAGQDAADSARALGAGAYTAGSSIVFGQGRYAPATRGGRELLAHELAHVIQQERGGRPAGAAAEREAARTGALAARGRGRPVPVRLGAHGLQRQPETGTPEPVPVKDKPPATDAQDAAAIGELKKALCLTAKDGFEWCGLVIQTAKGDHRITGPGTSKSESDCAANATVCDDEKVVAYYHSHPAGQGDDFSEAGHGRAVGDLDESESKKWDWYLVNSKGGMKRYVPSRDERGRGTKRDIGTAPECS
jgi:proteasome lid subunit RPN8/RPN11